MTDNFIKVINQDNNEFEIKIVTYFKLNDNNKEYVIFRQTTDNDLHVSIVNKTGEKIKLVNIEDEEEMNSVNKVIESLIK